MPGTRPQSTTRGPRLTHSPRLTLQQLGSLLNDLQELVDLQTKRIAQMQAELDVLPVARKRRESLRALLTAQSSHNGNGDSATLSRSR